MAVGDEIGLTEDLYQELIGRYVATIEVISKRIVLKDQRIAKLETEASQYDARIAELEKQLAEPKTKNGKKPKDGDVHFGEQPPQ